MTSERELTITLITNSEGYEKILKHINDNYLADIIYENNVRYNTRKISERERLQHKYLSDDNINEDIVASKFYRVVMQNTNHEPIPFTEMERYTIPEKYYYNNNNNNNNNHTINHELNDDTVMMWTTPTSTNTRFQTKTVVEDSFELIPYTLSVSSSAAATAASSPLEDSKEILVGCTWKYSIEEDLTEEEFASTVFCNINDIDGSYVPVFGQQRCCVYNIRDTNIRLSVGKAFQFGGVQVGRRCMDPYYYVEWEMELCDSNSSSTKQNSLKDMRQFVRNAFDVFPHDILYKIIKGARDVCVGPENRVVEVLDDYPRHFTHDFEKFRSKVRLNKKITTESCEIETDNVFLAPKWNGIRGIAIWENDILLTKSVNGFGEYYLPSYCLQRLIVQVELFIKDDDNNNNKPYAFIVTEIFGTSLCTRNQLYGYFLRNVSQQYHFSRDQCNMTDTFGALCPRYSLELLMKFHMRNPARFTCYRKCTRFIDIVNWFFMKKKLPSIKTSSASSSYALSAANHSVPPADVWCSLPTDGVLAITIYDDGKNSLYAKLKTSHTIELAYDVNRITLCTYEKDTDLLKCNVKVCGIDNSGNLRWYATRIDSRILILEFEILPNDVCNGYECAQPENEEQQLLRLLQRVTLKFVKIRYDKFIADTNRKILDILQNYFVYSSNK